MLWLALHFPQLLIDTQIYNSTSERAIVVVRVSGNQKFIMQCNSLSERLKIKPGFALNTALAIEPSLQIINYSDKQQLTTIRTLSQWALQYSSKVCIDGNNSLLIEVKGSLKLFSGLNVLLDKMLSDIKQQGFKVNTSIAPTPNAALLLAHAKAVGMVLKKSHIETSIASIDTEHLQLDDFSKKALQQSGIQECHQLLNIPIAALNRRFGKEIGIYLFKLLGRIPDPRAFCTRDTQFQRSLDLPQETENIQILQFSLNRLIAALCGFLCIRDQGVEVLLITLKHHHHKATFLKIRFAEATSKQKHLLKVCSERLENTHLPEPAISIHLQATQLGDATYYTPDLFDKKFHHEDDIHQLLDRLRARLGRNKLYTLATQESHLPERAWKMTPVDAKNHINLWPLRPLWLLEEFKTTPSLDILSTSERIETPWFEDSGDTRNYFIARDKKTGSLYWVFQSLSEENSNDSWKIHGIFS